MIRAPGIPDPSGTGWDINSPFHGAWWPDYVPFPGESSFVGGGGGGFGGGGGNLGGLYQIPIPGLPTGIQIGGWPGSTKTTSTSDSTKNLPKKSDGSIDWAKLLAAGGIAAVAAALGSFGNSGGGLSDLVEYDRTIPLVVASKGTDENGNPIVTRTVQGSYTLNPSGKVASYDAAAQAYLGVDEEGKPKKQLAKGGVVEADPKRTIVQDAMLALQGKHPRPEQAIQRFAQVFGPDALDELVEMISGKTAGAVKGPGTGVEDKIPGTINGQRDVLLSDGEFVVPADVVSGLGDGSSRAGAQRLYQLMAEVRKQKTGSTKAPPKMPQGLGALAG